MVANPINTQAGDAQATRKDVIRKADEELLATLGYKQEFKRAFNPLEVSSARLHIDPAFG
jgi:hypothetical protein